MIFLYIFLGIVSLLLIGIIIFSIVLDYNYTHPKVVSYEYVKQYHLDRDIYYNYDELKKEDYIITLKDGYEDKNIKVWVLGALYSDVCRWGITEWKGKENDN